MNNAKFRLAIVGGGISGLTLAIALTKSIRDFDQNIRIDLYESAQEFTEIGAGVTMLRRPWKIMQYIGVAEELKHLVHVPDIDARILAFEFRKSDQPQGLGFYEMYTSMGILTFHRSEFQKVLSEHLDPSTVTTHFRKRLISYTQTSSSDGIDSAPITLEFKDGTTATCDVLIGTDGIHSWTRGKMYRDMAEGIEDDNLAHTLELLDMKDPEWSGSFAYRGVIPKEQLETVAPGHRALSLPMNYLGKDKHVITYPISGGRLVNVVAFCSQPEKEGTVFEGKAVENRPQQELLDEFKGWEHEVMQILQCIEKPSRWAINQMKGLPTYVHRRVAILGDSAHAMTTHQGSGAGQGIDGAYILASLLSHPLTTPETLSVALEIYDAIRRPMGNGVVRRSARNGHFYELNDTEFCDLARVDPPISRLKELGDAIVDNWKWAWTTDAEDDRVRAINLLEERLEGV